MISLKKVRIESQPFDFLLEILKTVSVLYFSQVKFTWWTCQPSFDLGFDLFEIFFVTEISLLNLLNLFTLLNVEKLAPASKNSKPDSRADSLKRIFQHQFIL